MFMFVLFTVTIRNIPNERVNFVRELGEGAFGRVYLGLCLGLSSEDDMTMVAIKTLKVLYLHACMNDTSP